MIEWCLQFCHNSVIRLLRTCHTGPGVDHHGHNDHRRPMSIKLSSLVKIWSHSMLSLHKNRLILVPALKHRAPTEQFINIANCEQCLRAQLLSSVLEQSGTITLIGGTWKWHTIFFERKNGTLHSACFFLAKDPLPAFINKKRVILCTSKGRQTWHQTPRKASPPMQTW